ncbi:hypothetical protein [Chryseobacterium camelliae]|uniref:hypothetical protein n=1 Tax=Chryseobacterium camelliae TaxID=1265445 RepID=UPI000C1CA110|nr:hypothetical protein [Chryseobacterium camelliae]MDR6515444.1 phosphoribosyl-ATP pyrophosphohydrolase [Chryseobacterium camelliae]
MEQISVLYGLFLTLNTYGMNCQQIVKTLKSEHFIQVNHRGNCFEKDATVYAKEIKDHVFLLFIILKETDIENVQAQIACFDRFQNIGFEEPEQIMFCLTIKNKKDLRHFETFLHASDN